MQAVYKIIDYKLANYKKYVRANVESEDGYDLFQLEQKLDFLQYQSIYREAAKDKVYKQLFKDYLSKKDLLKRSQSLDLYYSRYKQMEKEGILVKVNDGNVFGEFHFIIVDKMKFRKLSRDTIRFFLCIVLRLEYINFLLNYASRIAKENKILSDDIVRILKKYKLQKPKDIGKQVKKQFTKQENYANKTRDDKTVKPSIMSFYSKPLKTFRRNYLIEFSTEIEALFKLMKGLKLLNDDSVTLGRLITLFTEKTLPKNRPIIWLGSAYELKQFTNLLGETLISESIRPYDVEKWEIVKCCFHVKLNGRPLGPIQNSTSISGAKSKKSDSIEKIVEVIEKIKSIHTISLENSN